MQITLTEAEVKQAVTEYLSKRFVLSAQVGGITMTAGSKAKGVITQVDLSTLENPLHFTKPIEEIPVTAKIEKIKAKKSITGVTAEPGEMTVFKTLEVKEPKIEATKTNTTEEPVGVEDMFGEIIAPKEKATPIEEEKTKELPPAIEEAPIVEGENTMTKNFDIPLATPTVAAPIVDDVEDLFAC